MKIVTFRYQQFNAAIQEQKDLETDTGNITPYSQNKLKKLSDFPGSENDIHIRHLDRISNRDYVILGSWQ
ncbi:hypothetical protein [Desulfogranum japonicum]|uniref:hypothetical protein n=1 Tax=Desulfogranum japonicum TaxID=231447 RepID=UPI000403E7F6|nr:hypothetical protein [Desulfogranum japonicum]